MLGSSISGESSSGSSGSSAFSVSGRSAGRRLAAPRCSMEIQLDSHFRAKVYTSGDSITGTVTIVPQRDMPFDLFEIVLSGTAYTRLEGISVPVESSHVFLKLFMPIADAAYPLPRVLEARQTYTLPFHFVVPHHLTLSACSHKVASPRVNEHHVRLPPTLGGAGSSASSAGSTASTTASWERDDLAPDMARVEYAVKARVYQETAKDSGSGKPGRTVLAEAAHQLRVLPASLAEPPLQIAKNDRAYKLRTTKSVRKGLFARSKLGTVTAAVGDDARAPLPAPFVLRPDGIAADGTTAFVRLYFDPARHDIREPVVTGVSAKLTAHTYFSASAISVFPNLGDWARSDNVLMERRGTYTTSVPLASGAAAGFEWEPVVSTGRHDPGYCSSDSNDERAAQPGGRRRVTPPSSPGSKEPSVAYEARLELPLELPVHKRMFLPTFHACIVSRTYSLQLSISMVPRSSSSSSTSSPSGAATTVTLSLPVQVVVGDGSNLLAENTEALPSFDDAVEEAEADALLRPRVLSVPDARYQQTSTLPGYSR